MSESGNNGSRRDFLKVGAAGLAGITMIPSLVRGEGRGETRAGGGRGIVTRRFGRTGLDLPVVSLGAGRVSGPELVAAALDRGIVMIDTAHSYGRGQNEEMIGGVIKDRPRGSYVLATKISGPEDRKTGLFTKEATSKLFLDKFETSLKRLGLDYVDILYIHSVVKRESVLYEPFLSTMVKLKKVGRTRFIGVSTHGNEPEVIRTAARSGVYDVVLTAYNFRQPHLAEVDAALEEASRADVGIVAMKTQAGVYWDRERQKQINMKAALKWTLLNKNVHTTIPGIATFDQLETDLSVMDDIELTPEEKKDLQLGSRLGLPGLYCRQCGKCIEQCRRELDIPTYMRSFMYTYGYRDLAAAVEAMSAVRIPKSPCGGCVSCSVTCTMGFDVKSRVTDIARIRFVPEDFVV